MSIQVVTSDSYEGSSISNTWTNVSLQSGDVVIAVAMYDKDNGNISTMTFNGSGSPTLLRAMDQIDTSNWGVATAYLDIVETGSYSLIIGQGGGGTAGTGIKWIALRNADMSTISLVDTFESWRLTYTVSFSRIPVKGGIYLLTAATTTAGGDATVSNGTELDQTNECTDISGVAMSLTWASQLGTGASRTITFQNLGGGSNHYLQDLGWTIEPKDSLVGNVVLII